MMKRLTNLRKEIIYQDSMTKSFYRRITGALGWPWEPKPGFIVVIGERYAVDQGLRGRPLVVLAERKVESIGAIHQGCLELRKQWACDTWLADLENEEALRLFRRLNRGQPMTRSDHPAPLIEPLWLRAAPYSHGEGSLQVLFQMLGMVQSPESKLLSYGPNSKLPGYAMGLDAKDFMQPTGRYPALAALSYAVAEMLLREPWTGRGNDDQRVIVDWDRYKLGG